MKFSDGMKLVVICLFSLAAPYTVAQQVIGGGVIGDPIDPLPVTQIDPESIGLSPITSTPMPVLDLVSLGDDVCQCMDLVFIIDTSGSMGDDGALANIKSENGLPAIIDLAVTRTGDTPQNSELRLGLITFRGIVSVKHPLTDDIDEVETSLGLLTASGGVTGEASDEAIREMLRPVGCTGCGSGCHDSPFTLFDQPFRPQCIRHAVLITDERPTGCNAGGAEWPGGEDQNDHEGRSNYWADQAAEAGIIVSAMYIGDEPNEPFPLEVRVLKHYAEATDGLYAAVGTDANTISQELSAIIDHCPDCNSNGVSDYIDIVNGTSYDCNSNGIPDECEMDCNSNGIHDDCDIASGTSTDCNSNSIPDECESMIDCNNNGVHDFCDITGLTSSDCNENWVPDECETLDDCNGNDIQDICEIYLGTSTDCNNNNIPDECEGPIYVDWNASGLNNGTTWTDAFNNLQDALDAACESWEIWVAEGTYVPEKLIEPGVSETATFELTNGVKLYGGFSGTETSRDQRMPGIYKTILSGDLDGNDFEEFGYYYYNSYHVVTIKPVGPSVVLDGFVISGGYAHGISYYNDGYSDKSGAGIIIHSGSGADPVISNCVLIHNQSSDGGAALRSSHPISLVNVAVIENKCNSTDSGVINLYADTVMTNCTVFRNLYGGVTIGGYYRNVTVENSILYGNFGRKSTEQNQIRGSSTPVISNSCIQGLSAYAGNSNIGDNPLFESTATSFINLRLSPDSPCIDAGNNSVVPVDSTIGADGYARKVDGDGDTVVTVDMGAYEYYVDCNMNDVPDAMDISGGTSTDCNTNGVPDECDPTGTYAPTQWADYLIDVSTSWGWDSLFAHYHARQVLGEPDVPLYGDAPVYGDDYNAWAYPYIDGQSQYITVGYYRPVLATGATIVETLNHGYVTQVDAVDTSDVLHTVWTGTDNSTSVNGEAALLELTWPATTFLVKGLRIYVDTDHVINGSEQLDAVMLHGLDGIDTADANSNGILDECE